MENEKLKELFEGSELSEDFKSSIQSLFDKTLEESKEELRAQIEEEYAEKAEEYSKYVVAELEEKTDQYVAEEILPQVERYLDYAVKTFVEENEVPVQNQLRVEAAEKLLSGMVELSESCVVRLPEGQEDAVAKLQEAQNELTARFDSVMKEKAEVEAELNGVRAEIILSAKTGDLTESQRERFVKAASGVEFKDQDQYSAAIDSLLESYFPAQTQEEFKESEEQPEEEHITESKDSWMSSMFSQV